MSICILFLKLTILPQLKQLLRLQWKAFPRDAFLTQTSWEDEFPLISNMPNFIPFLLQHENKALSVWCSYQAGLIYCRRSSLSNALLPGIMTTVAKFPQMGMWVFYAIRLWSIKIYATDVPTHFKTTPNKLNRRLKNCKTRYGSKLNLVDTFSWFCCVLKLRFSET